MALNTPVAQAATDVSQVGFKAHWMIPPGGDNPTGLRLDVSTDVNFAAGTFVPNFENRLVGAGVVAMDIPGLAAGTTYHYRLRSEGAGGATSTGSNVISVTTTAAAPPPPPPPQSPVVGIGNVLLVSGGMTFVGPPNTIPLVMLQPQPAQPTPTPTVSQPQHRPPAAPPDPAEEARQRALDQAAERFRQRIHWWTNLGLVAIGILILIVIIVAIIWGGRPSL